MAPAKTEFFSVVHTQSSVTYDFSPVGSLPLLALVVLIIVLLARK